jgi:tRNA modification GTPase
MTPGDTIAAVSSAVGPAARMIVRLGGPAAWRIGSDVAGEMPEPGGAARRELRFAGLTVPAWVYAFRHPRSYTGDDLIEFHLPGNPLLARMLLDDLVRRGARHAGPGEFTARAYFNGRLDLTGAEGVAATIAANSEQELAAARQLLAGELARRLRPAMDAVAETLALVEVGIDFTDEDVTFLSAEQVSRRVAAAGQSLRTLLAESARFERLTHEPHFVLVGRPNAGKSTLLNALAGRERAVTSPVAGTTRDALTAEVVLPRGMVRVTDVAGIEEEGEPEDGGAAWTPVAEIEARMRQQALRAVEAADYVVLVRDATDARPPLETARHADFAVLTKADLLDPPGARTDDPHTLRVSAVTGRNLDRLRATLDRLAFGDPAGRSTLALNARHLRAIEAALAALDRAASRAGDGAAEVLALELREALDALGGVLGHVSPDDLLGRIFSSFCIGK